MAIVPAWQQGSAAERRITLLTGAPENLLTVGLPPSARDPEVPLTLVRVAVAAALSASALVAVQASAAPPPCKLVTDAAGDSNVLGPENLSPVPASTPGLGPNSPAVDILSADVAADKKRLTGVIRVSKLVATDPTSAPTGMSWRVVFTADEQVLSLIAQSDATGAIIYTGGYLDTTTGSTTTYGAGSIKGVFDTAKNEIRMTAEHSLFAEQATIKSGTKLTDLRALTGRIFAVPDAAGLFGGGAILSFTPTSDEATSTKTYAVGGKSCVVVNK